MAVIDKPSGPTSFDVVRAVRRAFGVRKVGHTGTLDPFATGVLAVCVGAATRLVPWLQKGDKEYVAEVLLGVATDTLDPHGEVTHTDDAVPTVDDAAVREALAPMEGVIEQVPPVFSAIKVGGRRSYALARTGDAPELAPRAVELREAEVLEVNGPRIRLRVRTGPGFYVRALARDLAAALGTVGRLDSLRRTETGGLRLEDATTLERLREEGGVLKPAAEAVSFLPGRILSPEDHAAVRFGRSPRGVAAERGEEVRLLSAEGRLVALAVGIEEGVKLLRVFDSSPSSG